MTEIQSLLDQIAGQQVFLIGDVYLYEIIYGEVEKLADDSPIPVVQKHGRTLMAGGAGYTALLLSQLGIKVTLFTVLGDDPAGKQLLDILTEHGINTECVLMDRNYRTSSRTRVRVEGSKFSGRDIININATDPLVLSEEKKEYFSDYISSHIKDCHALVLQDQDRSIVTPALIKELAHVTKHGAIPHIGFSEQQAGNLKKFDVVTANVKSAQYLLNGKRNSTDQLGLQLRSKIKCKTLYLSPGCEGISLVTGPDSVQYYPAGNRNIQDVIGIDQAVLTAVTAGVLGDLTPQDTAELANVLTASVIAYSGYAVIGKVDLLRAEKQYRLHNMSGKHVSIDQLQVIVKRAQMDGKKVVWTNGCYDILHAGHVIYLERSRQLGDILVVGLNSDASVKRNKGDLRPVVEENERAKVLSALSCVDYVVVFDDTSPVGMIDLLRPDIYAKGGDYTIDTINQEERRLVEGYGGEIALLPGVPGMSTSEIINRVLKAYGGEAGD